MVFSGLLFAIVLALFGFLSLDSKMDKLTNDLILDEDIPDIELAQLDLENSNGEKVQLTSGKPLILNFWATWCGPCVEEFPAFEELYEKYTDTISFVMVSDEKLKTIEKFKAKKGYKLNMLRSIKPFDEYGLTLRPATYFYDSQGKLINNISGAISKQVLEKEVLSLLK